MTITIKNLADTANVDIAAIAVPVKTNFVLVDTKVDGVNREALFQKVTGDEDSPMTVRVGFYPNDKAEAGYGRTNLSIKIQSYVCETDSEDEEVSNLPCTATLATSMPGKSGVPNSSDMLKLLGNLFTWMVPVVSGAIDDGALDRLKFGVVNDLNTLVDTASV
jgi:hypothetical protein